MGAIQNAMNSGLAAVAGAFTVKEMVGDKKMEAKYGPGGEVEQDVLNRAGLKDANIEQKQEVRPFLREMAAEARTTDLREQRAKWGFIPNKKSREINKAGHARKDANIAYLAQKFGPAEKAADALKKETDSKTEQASRLSERLNGGDNPLLLTYNQAGGLGMDAFADKKNDYFDLSDPRLQLPATTQPQEPVPEEPETDEYGMTQDDWTNFDLAKALNELSEEELYNMFPGASLKDVSEKIGDWGKNLDNIDDVIDALESETSGQSYDNWDTYRLIRQITTDDDLDDYLYKDILWDDADLESENPYKYVRDISLRPTDAYRTNKEAYYTRVNRLSNYLKYLRDKGGN